jgi:hypothetical protein
MKPGVMKAIAIAALVTCAGAAGATQKGGGRARLDKAISAITAYNKSNGEGGRITGQRHFLGIIPMQISVAEVANRVAQGKKATLIHTKTRTGTITREYGPDNRADPLPHNVAYTRQEQYTSQSSSSTKVGSADELVTFSKTLE